MPTLQVDSARWLEPMLAQMSADVPSIKTAGGTRYYSPRAFVSDGVIMELDAPQLDGKGMVSDTFVPRRGVIGVGVNPVEPVTTPRKATWVRPGVGIGIAFIEFGAAIAAQQIIENEKARAMEEGQAKAKCEEDGDIAACIMAAAQTAAAGIGAAVKSRVMTKKGVRSPPRVRVYGYSRKKA